MQRPAMVSSNQMWGSWCVVILTYTISMAVAIVWLSTKLGMYAFIGWLPVAIGYWKIAQLNPDVIEREWQEYVALQRPPGR